MVFPEEYSGEEYAEVTYILRDIVEGVKDKNIIKKRTVLGSMLLKEFRNDVRKEFNIPGAMFFHQADLPLENLLQYVGDIVDPSNHLIITAHKTVPFAAGGVTKPSEAWSDGSLVAKVGFSLAIGGRIEDGVTYGGGAYSADAEGTNAKAGEAVPGVSSNPKGKATNGRGVAGDATSNRRPK